MPRNPNTLVRPESIPQTTFNPDILKITTVTKRDDEAILQDYEEREKRKKEVQKHADSWADDWMGDL